MKSIISKIFLLILAMAVAFSFTACGEDTGDDTNDGTNDGTGDTGDVTPPDDGNDDPEKLVLIEDSKALFRIVTTSNVDAAVLKSVENFIDDLKDIDVEIDAYVNDSDKNAVTDCEIIVGTGVRNRDEKFVLNARDYGSDGYVIKVVDNKVLIGGGTKEQTKTAFEYFIKNVVKLTSKTKELSELKLERSYEKLRETDYLIDSVEIGGVDLSNYVFVSNAESSDYPTVKGFREELYAATGYWLEKVSEGNIPEGKNVFSVKMVDEAGATGFRAYVDSSKNFIVECAYANAMDLAFESLIRNQILSKIGNVSLSASFEQTYTVNVVFYSQFGALGNGVADDYEAIYNTHVFANAGGQKVMGDGANARYYIHEFTKSIPIRTNVDWNGSTFYIDDTGSEVYRKRDVDLFKLEKDYGAITYSEAQIAADPELKNLSLKAGDTAIPALAKYAETTSLVLIKNNHYDYIRHGYNINGGAPRQDTVILEPDGTLHEDTPIIFDFEAGYQFLNNGLKVENLYTPAVTSITMYRTDDKPIVVENGIFEREVCKTVIETQYLNSYDSYRRGILCVRANAQIKNISHKLLNEPYMPNSGYGQDAEGKLKQSYPYSGMVIFNRCNDSKIVDCSLNSHTMYYRVTDQNRMVQMGSYDFNIMGCTNIDVIGITDKNDHRDSHYWGIVHSNRSKNLNFKDCVISRFDAHEGVWNASFVDCEFGQTFSLIGGGYVLLDNVTRCTGDAFIHLRTDYGSTFNGTVEMIDCTMQGMKPFNGGKRDSNYETYYDGANLYVFSSGFKDAYLVDEGKEQDAVTFPFLKWDFGYTCYMPQSIIMENFDCPVSDKNNLYVYNDLGDACFVKPDDFVQERDYANKIITDAQGDRAMTADDVYYNQYQITKSISFKNMADIAICPNEDSYLYKTLSAIVNAGNG